MLATCSQISDIRTNRNNIPKLLSDLLETNIRQRGIGNTNQRKMGLCIKELDRIYGIREVHISVKQHGRPGRTACHSAFNGVGR